MESSRPYDRMFEKQIAERAYHKWEMRGRPMGSPDVDWYQAVEEFERQLQHTMLGFSAAGARRR